MRFHTNSFIQGIPFVKMRRRRLTLESEASTDLVGSLVQVLGVEGSTEAEGDTRAEENVVSESGNTTVVNLGLEIAKMSESVNRF